MQHVCLSASGVIGGPACHPNSGDFRPAGQLRLPLTQIGGQLCITVGGMVESDLTQTLICDVRLARYGFSWLDLVCALSNGRPRGTDGASWLRRSSEPAARRRPGPEYTGRFRAYKCADCS